MFRLGQKAVEVMVRLYLAEKSSNNQYNNNNNNNTTCIYYNPRQTAIINMYNRI